MLRVAAWLFLIQPRSDSADTTVSCSHRLCPALLRKYSGSNNVTSQNIVLSAYFITYSPSITFFHLLLPPPCVRTRSSISSTHSPDLGAYCIRYRNQTYTKTQFVNNGCINCPFLQMESDQTRVQDCTTTYFSG